MKKLIVLVILTALVQISFSQITVLTGKWTSADKADESGQIELKADGTGLMNIEGRDIYIDEYTIDDKQTPIVIVMTTTANGKEMKFYALAEFIDGTTIRWELFPPDTDSAPAQFSSKSGNDNQIILRRGN